VLLDYADIIVHIQHEEDRVYYALERLWKDCPEMELPADINAHASQRVRAGEGQ
jgi:ribosome-associated protein